MNIEQRQRLKETLAEHRRNLRTAKREGLSKVVAREERIIARIENKLRKG